MYGDVRRSGAQHRGRALDRALRGAAPDRLAASKLSNDGTTPDFQRPACEYPKFPRYDRVGDPKKASSFVCSAT